MVFPSLPQRHDGLQWSDNVQRGHQRLLQSVEKAWTLLRQNDGDPMRLRAMISHLQTNCIPILTQLDQEVGRKRWRRKAVTEMGKVLSELDGAVDAWQDRYVATNNSFNFAYRGEGRIELVSTMSQLRWNEQGSAAVHKSGSIKSGLKRLWIMRSSFQGPRLLGT